MAVLVSRKPSAGGTPAQTLARGLRVLQSLGEPDLAQGATIAELSRRLGMTASSTYRYLTTLMALGYVVEEEATNRYRLGFQVLRLAAAVLDNQGIRAVAAPVLQELAYEVSEAVHLNVMDGTSVVLIDRVDSPRAVRMHLPVGTVLPAHCTASGKAMLARLSENEIQAVIDAGLEPRTSNTLTTAEALRLEIARVRAEGYALDDRESNEEVRCVAAAIVDFGGRVMGAISVSAPAPRMSLEAAATLGPRVKRSAEEISKRLGLRF